MSASTTIRIAARNAGYVWYDVLGVTPSRDRTLDEVKDQVEARWRDEQITSRLRAKADDMVEKLKQGGKLADEAAEPAGSRSRPRPLFKRDATMPAVPDRRDRGRVPRHKGRRRPGAGRRSASDWSCSASPT